MIMRGLLKRKNELQIIRHQSVAVIRVVFVVKAWKRESGYLGSISVAALHLWTDSALSTMLLLSPADKRG